MSLGFEWGGFAGGVRLVLGAERRPVEAGICVWFAGDHQWLPAVEWAVVEPVSPALVVLRRRATGELVEWDPHRMRTEVLTLDDDGYQLRDWPPDPADGARPGVVSTGGDPR